MSQTNSYDTSSLSVSPQTVVENVTSPNNIRNMLDSIDTEKESTLQFPYCSSMKNWCFSLPFNFYNTKTEDNLNNDTAPLPIITTDPTITPVESRSIENTPVGTTSVGTTSVGTTSVGTTSVGTTSVGTTSVGTTSVETTPVVITNNTSISEPSTPDANTMDEPVIVVNVSKKQEKKSNAEMLAPSFTSMLFR